MTAETALAGLLEAAEAAYEGRVRDADGRASVARIFAALDAPLEMSGRAPARLDACRYLPQALETAAQAAPDLARLSEAFATLEPHLHWQKRQGDTTRANAAYEDGHANAVVVGAGGVARHARVLLGVSLLAPGVRYPDHTHPPEETYLVLSEGDFSQDGETWFTPGIGGTFYNPPGILHAMRSGDTALFAMWALWAER